MNGTATNSLDSQRQRDRESIFLSASVRFATAPEAVVVRIRNISSGGMMVDCHQPVAPGELLEADIKNIGRVRGRVAWRTDNRMGIAFDVEIDPKRARLAPMPDPREPAYTNLTAGRRPGLGLR